MPVLSVNLGKLGFLADLSPGELCSCFAQVLKGDYHTTSHLMFSASSNRPTIPERSSASTEIAIQAGPPFQMIELDLIVDGETVTCYQARRSFCTVGSTAHSLSAGNSILGQELSAFVITPICPHTLTNPVVDSADRTYTIVIRSAAHQHHGGSRWPGTGDGDDSASRACGARYVFDWSR